MPKTELQIPKPRVSPEQIASVHSARGIYDFKGKVWGDENLSWTILYAEENELSKPVYSRVIMVHAIDDIRDSLKHVDENIQTIGLQPRLKERKNMLPRRLQWGLPDALLLGGC